MHATALACSRSDCDNVTDDAGRIGKLCGHIEVPGSPRCRGRLIPWPRTADERAAVVGPVVVAEVVDDFETGAPGSNIALLAGRVMKPLTGDEGLIDAETDEMYWEGIPENTQKIYTYQWSRVVRWGGDTGVEVLPMSVDACRRLIKDHMTMKDSTGRLRGRKGQPYAPDTVRLTLAVISVVHQAHGLPNPTHDGRVIRQMRGYARTWKKAGYRADIAYAPTPEEVIAMVRVCDLTTCAGLRDAVLIRLAFDTGRRNSELLSLNWRDVRWISPTRMLVSPPFAKTNKDTNEEDEAIGIEADEDLAPDVCLVVLFREWKELSADRGHTDGPVFVEVNAGARRKNGHSGVITHNRMTRVAFQIVVAKYAKATGVDRDPVTGEARKVVPHSLRAAFATAAEEANVPPQATMDRGGWSRTSPEYLKYWRSRKKWGDRNPAVMIRRVARKEREDAEAKALEASND